MNALLFLAILILPTSVSAAEVPEARAERRVPTPLDLVEQLLKEGKPAEALAELTDLADDGNDPPAQVFLAFVYAEGVAVARDEAKALKYFKKAAENGHAVGQYELGIRLEGEEGRKWLQASMQKGYAPAFTRLADRHRSKSLKGKPNPDYDPRRAKELLEQAVAPKRRGNIPDPEAMLNLALLLTENKENGLAADPARVNALVLRAAELGYTPAQEYLAARLNDGLNPAIPKDEVQAYVWWYVVMSRPERATKEEFSTVARREVVKLESKHALNDEQIRKAREDAARILEKIEP